MGEQLIEGLRWLTLIVAAVVFVVVEARLLRAAWRLRPDAAPAPDARPPVRLSRARELLWTALPAVGLLVLALFAAWAAFDG